MPYIVKLYDPQYGDVDEVFPAESIDDAVGKVLEVVEQSPDNEVEATMLPGGFVKLKVSRGDTVLADVEDVPFVGSSGLQPNADAINTACDALVDGNTSVVKALFAGTLA